MPGGGRGMRKVMPICLTWDTFVNNTRTVKPINLTLSVAEFSSFLKKESRKSLEKC